MNSQPLLHATSLTKDFGNSKGIFDVDLSVMPGQVIGFVGPNGSGKSTTINILTGLIKSDEGDIEVFGNLYNHATLYKVMSQIGVMYSELTIDSGLTAETIFKQTQAILGEDFSHNWKAMAATLELDSNKPIKKLSLGNKKKVGIIHALMHNPKLIIMDEPTSGLDPIIQERFLGLIRNAADNGAGILLSSHNLNEIQEIADLILMIKSGKIIISDSTETILSKAQRTFRIIKPSTQLQAHLKTLPYISRYQRSQADFVFNTDHHEAAIKFLAKHKFYNYFIERPSLEEAFKEYYE